MELLIITLYLGNDKPSGYAKQGGAWLEAFRCACKPENTRTCYCASAYIKATGDSMSFQPFQLAIISTAYFLRLVCILVVSHTSEQTHTVVGGASLV